MAMKKGTRKVKHRVPLKVLARVASVSAGVQFGWALQLSLLTPYVQELGIPHQFASLIWLCGPVSGILVQPIVGHYSDHCTSSYGRRRPFIVIGAILVCCAVVIIGYSADLGYFLGDDINRSMKPRAIVVFVLGFWLLDLANNILGGPCRALLADYAGKDEGRARHANAFFSLFMGVGNTLGYATGTYDNWGRWLPFTLSDACDRPCANLKSAFLLGTVLLIITTILSVTAVTEIPWSPKASSTRSKSSSDSSTPLLGDSRASGISRSEAPKLVGNLGNENQMGKVEDPEDDDEDDEQVSAALVWELLVALRDLPKTMWYILWVTALTWFAWFPFLLFDTDWMGREVYLGQPTGLETSPLSIVYYAGVHMGTLGLMLNSVVLSLSSLLIDFMCRKIGPSRLWGLANIIMAMCFASTAVISLASRNASKEEGYTKPPDAIVGAAIAVFAVLGIPFAITTSLPYALTATYAAEVGRGQGLSMGIVNLAAVIAQLVASVGSGPFDALFGGGNLPSFLLGSGSALLGCIAAVLLLPQPPPGLKSLGGLRRTRSSRIP